MTNIGNIHILFASHCTAWCIMAEQISFTTSDRFVDENDEIHPLDMVNMLLFLYIIMILIYVF